MSELRCWVLLIVAAATVVATGCGKSVGPETIPVSGIVMMGGEPVEGASVSFEPIGGGEGLLSSQGVTDAEGRFTLQTHVGNNQFKEGLQSGDYGVAITKLEVVSDMRRRPKDLLPRKFGNIKTSGLNAHVSAESQSFEFKLD